MKRFSFPSQSAYFRIQQWNEWRKEQPPHKNQSKWFGVSHEWSKFPIFMKWMKQTMLCRMMAKIFLLLRWFPDPDWRWNRNWFELILIYPKSTKHYFAPIFVFISFSAFRFWLYGCAAYSEYMTNCHDGESQRLTWIGSLSDDSRFTHSQPSHEAFRSFDVLNYVRR